MATIDWLFVCDYAMVDPTGKASIIGTFEDILVTSLPAVQKQFYLAMACKSAPGEVFAISSKFTSPTGHTLAESGPLQAMTPPNQPGRAIFTIGYFMVNITEFGPHAVEIFMNGNPVTVAQINVRKI